MDIGNEVAGIGPLSVAPSCQSKGIGRALMNAMIDMAKQKNFKTIRIMQETQNRVSFSLYLKTGFDVVESIVLFTGHISQPYSGPIEVRKLAESDVVQCDELHKKVVGISRLASIHQAVQNALVAISQTGEIIGFSNGFSVLSFAVAKAGHEDALYALHSAFSRADPNTLPCLKVIARVYPSLARRCLEEWGLKTHGNLTQMCFGKYTPISPDGGVYIPANAY
eukprot:Phypoly_transcript_12088.p1 GENE.Phypoly_transcript_12088~~Phypoly_transcript_12088.p1  ORF type:complete len:223 (+),score=27.88 Phypoly_transcript_12088:414-1082(+)